MGGLTKLLEDVEKAYDKATKKAESLTKVRAEASAAVAAKKAELEAVTAEQAAYIGAAQDDADKAQADLEALRGQVHERLGNVTGAPANSRVSVK